MSAREHVAWPVIAFPVQVTYRGDGLDPFERLILEMYANGLTDPGRLHHLSGLAADFIAAIHAELEGRGAIDATGTLTQAGRAALANDVEQVAPGWMGIDCLDGRPLPVFWEKLPSSVSHPLLGEMRAEDDVTPDPIELVGAYEDWRRLADPPPQLRDTVASGVRVLGRGTAVRVAVDLSVGPDGHPQIDSPTLPGALLADRLEHTRPRAWTDLTARLATQRAHLKAQRESEAIRSKAAALFARTFGEVEASPTRAHLMDACVSRILAPSIPGQAQAALTSYRKFTEAFATRLSPTQLSEAAVSARDALPRRQAFRDAVIPRLEALGHPEPLQLPERSLLNGWLSGLRKLRAQPTHGVSLQIWPFWAALLDPGLPSSRQLRAVIAYCPSLLLELNAVRVAGNPGAHHGSNSAVDFAPIDEHCRRLLASLDGAVAGGATTRKPPRGLRGLSQTIARPDDVWRPVAAWATALPRDASVDIHGWAEALSQDSHHRRQAIERAVDDLCEPDDDGIGFEVPEWLGCRFSRLVDDLIRRRPSAELQAIGPILRVAAKDQATRAALVDRTDVWTQLEAVSAAVDLIGRAGVDPIRWRTALERAQAVIDGLSKEP